jgi:hypothetical protein
LHSKLTPVRLALLTSLGQTAAAAFPPVTPEEYAPRLQGVVDEEGLKYAIESSGDRGAFDPDLYSTDLDTYHSVEVIVRLADAAECKVVIVLMPESSSYRALMPEIAIQSFRQFVRESLADKQPRVVDLREAIPDRDFADAYHVNAEGRRKLTESLARQLNVSDAIPQAKR